jgi:hypothetical protein
MKEEASTLRREFSCSLHRRPFQTLGGVTAGTDPPSGGLFVNLAGRYANDGRFFLVKWGCPGRRQVEFSDRGGTSEECRGGPWTPICIKDHPASIPAINDAPHFLRSALSGFECRLGLDLFHQSLQWTPTDLTEISLIIRHEAPAVADAVDVNVSPSQVAVRFAVTAIANESCFRSHNLRCSPAI